MSSPRPQAAGLCERCRHARVVVTPRSAFWLCGRAQSDPRFERYPRLPVRECPGFEALADGESPARTGPGRPAGG